MEPRGIGVAGYMGAGKSTVTRWLAERGCQVIDADAEAKRFMNGSASIRAELAAAFGPEVVSGSGVDSPRLAEVVFNSFANLLRLNSIVHGPLLSHFTALVNAMAAPVWVMDGALISLWRTEHWFSQVFWVDAGFELRLPRLASKTGLPEDALRRRMDMQQRLFPPPVRPPWRRIKNEGTVADLESRLDRELSAMLPTRSR